MEKKTNGTGDVAERTKMKDKRRRILIFVCVFICIFSAIFATRHTNHSQNSTDNVNTPSIAKPVAATTVEDYGFDLSNLSVDKSVVVPGDFKTDETKALVSPQHVKNPEAKITGTERVIGVTVGNESRAYPINIMNRHEIANDTLGGVPIAVTYSPLTDSVVVFDRRIDPEQPPIEFGVSGLLYNSNLLMYDRTNGVKSDVSSLWSQLLMKSVAGPKAGTTLYALPAQLTHWQDWLASHPGTTVISGVPEEADNYKLNPYQEYFASGKPKFPVKPMAESDEHAWMKPVVVIANAGETAVFFHAYPPGGWNPAAGSPGEAEGAVSVVVTVGGDKFTLICRPPSAAWDAQTAEVVWDEKDVNKAPDYIVHSFFGAWYAMYRDTKFITPE